MMYITGAKPITRIIQEKAVTLHEKLIRLPRDKYWKNYGNNRGHLITQCGFTLKHQCKSTPNQKTLKFPRNPSEIMPVKTNLNIMQNVTKKETNPVLLKHLAVEMMQARYPTDRWMHMFTDGSKLDDHTHAGAFLVL